MHFTNITEKNLILYAAWRFDTSTNYGQTISKQISAIISTYNNHFRTGPVIDRHTYPTLKKVIHAIKKQPGRIDHKKPIALNHTILTELVATCNDSYDGGVLSTMFIFAKSFALRSGDYTITKKSPRFITWDDMQFTNHGNIPCVTLTLTCGKRNPYGKPEIMTQACSCEIFNKSICPPCTLLRYQQQYVQKFGSTDGLPLFRWGDGEKIQYKQFNEFFKEAMKNIGLQPSKYIKLHGFRFGGITDMRRFKVEDWLITKNTRHAKNSKLTWHYTQMSSQEEGLRIRHAMLKNKNIKNIYINPPNRP